MKVLNVIPRYSPAIGGSETWCRNLCLFLARKGIFTYVATINIYNVAEAFQDTFTTNELVRLGKKDYESGVFIARYKLWRCWERTISARIVNFLFYKMRLCKTQIGGIFISSPHSFALYKNLSKEIKGSDIVILHTLPYFHVLVGFILAKLYRKLIILVPYFHPGHIQYEKNIFFKIMNHCDAVITISEYEKRSLVDKGVTPTKIFISGSAIGIEEKQAGSENSKVDNLRSVLFDKYKIEKRHKKIIFLGRKEIYKGVFILIDALKIIAREENGEIFLFLVGPDTPDFNRVYSELGNLGNLKVINFGVVSEKEKDFLLEFSDLLVLPSEFESFGIVFLEAWKHRKPVIGTNHGAMPEVIGKAGVCAEYGNIDDLKDKIKRLLFDENLAREMGRIGKEKLEKEYSIENVYGSVSRVLNSLTNNKKRILIVSQLFHPYVIGGSEVAAYEQGNRLKNMGYEVRIFAGKINDAIERFSVSKTNKEFAITRINLHHQDFNHYTYANFSKRELKQRFIEELFEYAPDIVHFHNIYALSLDMIDACLEMNIVVVITLHDYWGICHKNLLLKENHEICTAKDGECIYCSKKLILENGDRLTLSERNSKCIEYYNRANLLVSPSKYLANRYIERGISKERLNIINYGIDTTLFKAGIKIRSSKIRLGYVGQIVWHKGVENLLNAMSLLDNTEREKISLSIFGSGSEKLFVDYCKTLARGLKFVKFFGEVEHNKINRVFRKIDILIIPSIWPENSPYVIMEAMATGTPVIASDIGGIPELVEDNKNGLIFKYDSPESLVEKIREIINNPGQIQLMRAACIAKAEEHDLSKQVRILSESYKRIIEEKFCENTPSSP